MLEALVAGTRDPDVLAELARGPLRPKIPVLRHALNGRLPANHALIVSTVLAKLDFLEGAIAGFSDAIEVLIGPFEVEVALLGEVPGVDSGDELAM
jgi:transposase